MTTPKGKYKTAGKPTKYSEDMLNKAYEYLDECVDVPSTEELSYDEDGRKVVKRQAGQVKFPNAGGLAVCLRVAKTTIYDWGKAHPEFQQVIDLMNAIQQDRLMNGGLSGNYNSTIASLILGRHGYHRTVDNNISNPDGSLSPMKELSKEQLIALAESQSGK